MSTTVEAAAPTTVVSSGVEKYQTPKFPTPQSLLSRTYDAVQKEAHEKPFSMNTGDEVAQKVQSLPADRTPQSMTNMEKQLEVNGYDPGPERQGTVNEIAAVMQDGLDMGWEVTEAFRALAGVITAPADVSEELMQQLGIPASMREYLMDKGLEKLGPAGRFLEYVRHYDEFGQAGRDFLSNNIERNRQLFTGDIDYAFQRDSLIEDMSNFLRLNPRTGVYVRQMEEFLGMDTREAMQTGVGLLEDVVTGVARGDFQELYEGGSRWARDAAADIAQAGNELVDDIGNEIGTFIQDIPNLPEQIIDEVQNTFTEMLDGATGLFEGAYDALADPEASFRSLGEAAWSGLQGVGEAVWSTMRGVACAFYDCGPTDEERAAQTAQQIGERWQNALSYLRTQGASSRGLYDRDGRLMETGTYLQRVLNGDNLRRLQAGEVTPQQLANELFSYVQAGEAAQHQQRSELFRFAQMGRLQSPYGSPDVEQGVRGIMEATVARWADQSMGRIRQQREAVQRVPAQFVSSMNNQLEEDVSGYYNMSGTERLRYQEQYLQNWVNVASEYTEDDYEEMSPQRRMDQQVRTAVARQMLARIKQQRASLVVSQTRQSRARDFAQRFQPLLERMPASEREELMEAQMRQRATVPGRTVTQAMFG
jgi:hypothetical protein